MDTIYTALMLLGAYLVGAIPVGYWITRKKTGKDIRLVGSGKTGATNVEREAGQGQAKITLTCDALKGAFIAFIALFNFGPLSWVTGVSLFLVIIGHRFSIFLYFASPPKYEGQGKVPVLTKIRRAFSRLKGGSGVASFLGFTVPIIVASNLAYPLTFLGTIGLVAGWVIVKKRRKIMSLANLLLLASIILYFGLLGLLVQFTWFTQFAWLDQLTFYPYLIVFTVITALFVMVNHWKNWQRLLKGTEPPTDFL